MFLANHQTARERLISSCHVRHRCHPDIHTMYIKYHRLLNDSTVYGYTIFVTFRPP